MLCIENITKKKEESVAKKAKQIKSKLGTAKSLKVKSGKNKPKSAAITVVKLKSAKLVPKKILLKAKGSAQGKKNKNPVAKSTLKTAVKTVPKKGKAETKFKTQAKVSASKKLKPQIKSKSASVGSSISKLVTPNKVAIKKIDFSQVLTPLDDRVLVEVEPGARMTAGGLHIPDTVEGVEGNNKGVVVAVGRGRQDKKGRLHQMDLKNGDKVVFQSFSGTKIKLFERDLVILRENEVLGVVS